MAEPSSERPEGIKPDEISKRIRTARENIELWNLTDTHLWLAFRDEFRDFTEHHLNAANRWELTGFRTLLRKRGVWVEVDRIEPAAALMNTLKEEEQAQWSPEEVERCRRREEFVSKELSEYVDELRIMEKEGRSGFPRRKGDNRRSSIRWAPNLDEESPGQQEHLEKERRRQQYEGRQRQQLDPLAEEEDSSQQGYMQPPPPPGGFSSHTPAPHGHMPPPPPPPGGFSPTPAPQGYMQPPPPPPPGGFSSPTPGPHGFSSPAPSSFRNDIAALAKLYTSEAKYNGDKDSFDLKLEIFHDLCRKAVVPEEAKMMAFSLMLKGRALKFYYDNFKNSTGLTLNQICYAFKANFEGEEYQVGVLNRWNSLTLRSVMNKNEGKSMADCFELLLDELRDLQHGLSQNFQNDDTMHNKLNLACRKMDACKLACFKPARSLAGLINDLRSSIATYNDRETESGAYFESDAAYFTDRRYRNAPRYRNDRQKMITDRAESPDRTDRPTTTPFDRGKKKYKCFICGKEGCWSSNHTTDEKRDSLLRLRDRINWRVNDEFDRQASQYLARYEGPQEDVEEISRFFTSDDCRSPDDIQIRNEQFIVDGDYNLIYWRGDD